MARYAQYENGELVNTFICEDTAFAASIGGVRLEDLPEPEPPLTNEQITEILKAMNGEEMVNMYNSIKSQGGRLVSKLISFINVPRAFPEWGWAA